MYFKAQFDFVFGAHLCLICHKLFFSCAEGPGRAGCWWSTAELLVCARVPPHLGEQSKDEILCFAAWGASAGKSPTSSTSSAGGCYAQLPIGACWEDGIPCPLAPRSTGPLWCALTYCVSPVRGHAQDVFL